MQPGGNDDRFDLACHRPLSRPEKTGLTERYVGEAQVPAGPVTPEIPFVHAAGSAAEAARWRLAPLYPEGATSPLERLARIRSPHWTCGNKNHV